MAADHIIKFLCISASNHECYIYYYYTRFDLQIQKGVKFVHDKEQT